MPLDSVDEVREAARALLARLFGHRPPAIRSLRPEPDDYALVFVDDVAAEVAAAYQTLWSTDFPVRVRPDQTELRVTVATVEDLIEGTGEAAEFPGGYREAAVLFRPGPFWVAWELRAPGSSAGMSFDGLVPLGGRWAWFPKPWRMMPSDRPRAVSHWTE